MATIMFGAGCFWGIEAGFRTIDGVQEVSSGYAGGTTDQPSYRDICTGTTGHAEVVEVIYDPEIVSFEDLLMTFWDCHDPTQVNRQGPDIGTQYRSAIFCDTADQLAIAQASKIAREAGGAHSKPIVTEISLAPKFWRAEEYHQRYFEKKGLVSCPTATR